MERSEERAAAGGVDDRTESIFEWLHGNSRLFGGALAVVAAVALGGWLYTRAQAGKELRAEQDLQRAQASIVQGNTPLAQTDLEKLVSSRGGTSGASQGAMLLAQLHYQAGEYQKGIDVLEKSGAARKEFSAPVEALIGDGYSQLGKFSEAASHYRKAAEATRFKADRENYLADAARNLTEAKDTSAARQIWQDLAAEQNSPLAAEAKVRLGELLARPAAKS